MSEKKVRNTFDKMLSEMEKFVKVVRQGGALEKTIMESAGDIAQLAEIRASIENVIEAIAKAKGTTLVEGVLDGDDEDGFMARSQLYFLAKDAIQLHGLIDDRDNLEPWIQSKIAQSSEAIEAVRRYTEYNAAKAEVAMPDDIADDGDVEEGFKILPNIDRERYQERDGLEGPFRTTSGKVVYYDPAEGRYYDPDSDIYLSHEEWDALNEDFLIEFLPALAALGLGAVRAAAGVAGGAARAIGRTAATSAMKAATAGLGQGGSSSDSDGMSSGYELGKTINSSAKSKGKMIEADYDLSTLAGKYGNEPVKGKEGILQTDVEDNVNDIAATMEEDPELENFAMAFEKAVYASGDTSPEGIRAALEEVLPDYIAGSRIEDLMKVIESTNEGKRPYVCVHARKGSYECYADTTYGAAKQAAEHWKLKNTAGIDVHLADKEIAWSESTNEAEYDNEGFTDKEIKMAFGIINDPRWKSGNMTHIVDTIEKIAKGLSKHPSVAKAIQTTNEDTFMGINIRNKEDKIKDKKTQIELAKRNAPKSGLTQKDVPQLEKELEDLMNERKMSGAEKTKEKKLKAKYDDSGMKKSMKDQYGDEEGMKVFYATLRKKAMTKGAK